MPETPKKRITLTEKYKALSEAYDSSGAQLERVSEALSNAVMMLRQEDIGWAAPRDSITYDGLSLSDLQGWSENIRASLTGTADKAPNPHMRNGIMLRHSYVWDGGIHYTKFPAAVQGKTNIQKIFDKDQNQRLVFGTSARRKREHALFADGLYLLVGENRSKTLRPVPLKEITDTQRSDLYEDEIVAYRWTRNEFDKTKKERSPKSYWIYVDWFEGTIPSTITYNDSREPVLKTHTAFDLHANRPDGAPFGSPDAIAAIVWARIIRDLIMNGVKMQDALAMFAFKKTSGTKAGQQASALELARPTSAGSVADMGGDNDMSPMSSAGRGYDFGSIGFIVSTMAASLHVSGIALSANTSLAGSSYGAAKTLDLPGRMAMQTRRAEHIEFDNRLMRWFGAPEVEAFFDNYDDATDEYRSVQAAMLAWQTGTITPEGFREELATIYGRKLAGAIPPGVIIPNNKAQEKPAAAPVAPVPVQAAAPNQGKSDGTGGAGHSADIPVKQK